MFLKEIGVDSSWEIHVISEKHHKFIVCWLCLDSVKYIPTLFLLYPSFPNKWKSPLLKMCEKCCLNSKQCRPWSYCSLKSHYAPAYSKNSGRALSVTPVRPVCTSVPIRVRAITPKPYGIYLWNFTGACMTLRRCVMNKDDNSCLFGFWIICPWLSSI